MPAIGRTRRAKTTRTTVNVTRITVTAVTGACVFCAHSKFYHAYGMEVRTARRNVLALLRRTWHEPERFWFRNARQCIAAIHRQRRALSCTTVLYTRYQYNIGTRFGKYLYLSSTVHAGERQKKNSFFRTKMFGRFSVGRKGSPAFTSSTVLHWTSGFTQLESKACPALRHPRTSATPLARDSTWLPL